MAKKNDAPDPPDYTDLATASVESAKIWEAVARDQLEWAKTTDVANRDLLERVLNVQIPQLEDAHRAAQADRARWEKTFLPVEDRFVREAMEYDTPQRREQEAARRIADVSSQFEAQRMNALRALEGYGIDPSQTRYGALDLGYRAQQAATQAQAANVGRREVEQTGRALIGEAINIGRGYPSQVAQSQGVVNQTATGAVGGATGVTAAGAGAYGSAIPFAQMGQGGYVNAANIRNMGYQNALDQYSLDQANTAGFWGGIGSLTGQLGSAYLLGRPKAEGGPVEPASRGIPVEDRDTLLTPTQRGEYVIPADVMKKKGTEFFDKLLDKYKDGGEYDQQRQGIPSR